MEKVPSRISTVSVVICLDVTGPGLGRGSSLPSVYWLRSAQLSFIISSFPLLPQSSTTTRSTRDISQNNPKKMPKISLWNPLQEPKSPSVLPWSYFAILIPIKFFKEFQVVDSLETTTNSNWTFKKWLWHNLSYDLWDAFKKALQN